jgi:hypothetical protein
MGIFDSFTGKPAKEAAKANSERLATLEARGMGWLDAGKTGALSSYDAAAAAYDPLKALGAKYGGGTDLYLDSLGVNGAEGNARAVGSFQTGPGYNFAVDQSLDALDRRAASRGMLGSGNTSIDTMSTVNGLANQEYGNWQNRLAGLIAPELSATGGAATGVAGANAGKGAVYMNDANARVNLATGVTTGQNSQATQAANAQMQGNANMWGAGMNLASMAMGMPTGGTSMLGGSGNAALPSKAFMNNDWGW